jgi:aspartate racemase
MKPVGILGGMGPEATVHLMQMVIDAVAARDDADHVPLIVHQNPAVPSRIRRLIDGTGDDPGPVLAQMARDLAAAGAVALAMPCNTAHAYAEATNAAAPRCGTGRRPQARRACPPAARRRCSTSPLRMPV